MENAAVRGVGVESGIRLLKKLLFDKFEILYACFGFYGKEVNT
jgi:hypothetical protein